MATHPSTLAWGIPWTEQPGGLQSTGLQSRTRLGDFTFSPSLWSPSQEYLGGTQGPTAFVGASRSFKW